MALNITIESTRLVEDKGNTYVAYLVRIELNDWDHLVEKRYSEFHELHRVMKLINRVIEDKLPKFPGQMIWKRIFGGFKEEDLQERKRSLQNYINELIATDCASTSVYFAQFFGMPLSEREKWIHGIQNGV